MAKSYMDYFREFKSMFPDYQDMYGDLARSTAGTYGLAAHQRGRAFTGLPTSGAYGKQQGDIWAQRGATLARSKVGLKELESRNVGIASSMALQKEQTEKQAGWKKWAGIGSLIPSLLSFIPGIGTAGKAGLFGLSGLMSLLGSSGGGGGMFNLKELLDMIKQGSSPNSQFGLGDTGLSITDPRFQ